MWRKMEMFVHGEMANPDYALEVVRGHLERMGCLRLTGRTFLELGPGDSLASGLIAKGLGADRSYLVDVGPFAAESLSVYRALAKAAADRGMFNVSLDGCGSRDDVASAMSIDYLVNGLEGLATIPATSVDVSMSQAVLEHVRKRDVLATLRELLRITRRGGVTSHRIDLRDHLGGGLNHLRFSEGLWERDWFAGAGFYTNRLRAPDWMRAFSDAGWEIISFQETRWKDAPTARDVMAQAFQHYTDSELLVSALDVVARRG